MPNKTEGHKHNEKTLDISDVGISEIADTALRYDADASGRNDVMTMHSIFIYEDLILNDLETENNPDATHEEKKAASKRIKRTTRDIRRLQNDPRKERLEKTALIVFGVSATIICVYYINCRYCVRK